jgi:CheY-like chemotaxis protein/CRP-like cAMP-binding protein
MSQTTTNPADASAVTKVIAEAFPDSHTDTISALADMGRVQTCAAGETIINQGAEGRLVLVIDGYIGLRRTTIDGRQLITRIATRGEVGAALPLADRPSAADLFALSASRVVTWWPGEARSLAENDPGFAMAIIDHVLASIETVVERVDGLLYQDAITRVARVLFAHHDLFFSDPPVLNRTHLPALVGTSREMTSRVMRVLEARGMVTRIGREGLAIEDLDALERAAIGPSGVRPRDIRNKFVAGRTGTAETFGRPRQLRATPGRRPVALPVSAEPVDPSPDTGPRTEMLVVVEHEAAARELTTAMLERAGYRVVTVADGRAAIEALANHGGSIDVLIADVVMPNVSGLELAEAIIERDPRIGLVLLSRYTAETLDLARVRTHGVVFAVAPDSSPDLLEAVQRATPEGR